MSPVRILSMDPGTNNFAYAIIRCDGVLPNGSLAGKIEQRGFIHSTVRDLRGGALREATTAFLSCVDRIVSDYHVDLWIGERYMLRRGSGGSAIESVNIMLGALVNHLKMPCRIMPASEWKLSVQRVSDTEDYLEGVYTQYNAADHNMVTEPDRVTVHEIDAIHIGIHGLNIAFEVEPRDYSLISTLPDATVLHLGTRYVKPKKALKRKAKPRRKATR